MMTKRKIVITGANGTVARYLIPGLTAIGYLVEGIARHSFPKPMGIDIHIIDYGNQSDLNDILRGADAVIHAAGLSRSADPRALYSANQAITETLVTSIKKYDTTRLIYLSSDLANNPIGPYGKSKLDCEQLISSAGLNDWICLRMAPFIGGDRIEDNSTFSDFIRRIKKGKSLWLPAGGQFPVAPLFATDLVALIDKVVRYPYPLTESLTVTGETVLLEEFLKLVAEKSGRKLKIKNFPSALVKWFLRTAGTSRLIRHPIFESLATVERAPNPSREVLIKKFSFRPSKHQELLSSLEWIS